LQFGDKQTERQTNRWTRPSHEAALAVASGGLITAVQLSNRDRHVGWSLQQEAHLSQRDRATLRVTEHFAKSLKVIRNDTFE